MRTSSCNLGDPIQHPIDEATLDLTEMTNRSSSSSAAPASHSLRMYSKPTLLYKKLRRCMASQSGLGHYRTVVHHTRFVSI
jgi:hypothetical protein